MRKFFVIGAVSLLFIHIFVLPVSGQEPHRPLQVDDMAQERIEEMLQDIEGEYPLLHGALIEVQQVNEEMYRHLLEEFSHHWNEFKRLQQENAELAEIEVRSRTIEIRIRLLEEQYHRKRTTEDKDTIKADIKTQLDELFELKVAKRKMEIARLEQELQQLTSELDQIVKNKEKHIQRRLDQMTQGDVFSW